MLFVWRGSVLKNILPQLFTVTLLSVLVVWAHQHTALHLLSLTPVPFTLLGIALAVFLGFRNSASYDRYWEGRKLWGALLNDGRTLARQACTLVNTSASGHREFVYALIAFVHALRHQLRNTNSMPEISELLPPGLTERVRTARFRPAVLLLWMAEWMREQRLAGKMDAVSSQSMERPLSGLTEVLGGCERIASTPLPFTYAVILHRTVYLFCFLLPFGLVDSLHYATPLIVALVSYTFFSLEALSDELEQPFGNSPNDLALTAMSACIEATLRETLQEAPLPPMPQPDRYILT
jgi:ion channel-forming bestrophin family protein